MTAVFKFGISAKSVTPGQNGEYTSYSTAPNETLCRLIDYGQPMSTCRHGTKLDFGFCSEGDAGSSCLNHGINSPEPPYTSQGENMQGTGEVSEGLCSNHNCIRRAPVVEDL
ncbi:unnamed protein product [Lasius platythorax]|uniref:Uncharacterized protein n=1 Tax=Lasius platythorax TaxID=488582 RepID=A0AAV2MYS4_9HYME